LIRQASFPRTQPISISLRATQPIVAADDEHNVVNA